jgi:hypothetical protein
MKGKAVRISLVLALIGSLALANILMPARNRFCMLSFYVVWAQDSYGDDINDTIVSQYNGSSWLFVQQFSANGSARVNENQSISFLVTVKFNATLLATNSSSGADSATRVNMTIVQADNASNIIWNNLVLNSTGTPGFTAPYWYVQKLGNWTTILPVSGVTYNCSIYYQGSY